MIHHLKQPNATHSAKQACQCQLIPETRWQGSHMSSTQRKSIIWVRVYVFRWFYSREAFFEGKPPAIWKGGQRLVSKQGFLHLKGTCSCHMDCMFNHIARGRTNCSHLRASAGRGTGFTTLTGISLRVWWALGPNVCLPTVAVFYMIL